MILWDKYERYQKKRHQKNPTKITLIEWTTKSYANKKEVEDQKADLIEANLSKMNLKILI